MMTSTHFSDRVLQIDCADYIKSVHRRLHDKTRQSTDGCQLVWSEHCKDKSGELTLYAEAMHYLATVVWPQKQTQTRIDWCRLVCVEYFLNNGLQSLRNKLARQKLHQGRNSPSSLPNQDHGVTCSNSELCNSDVADMVAPTAEAAADIILPFLGKIRLLDVGSCYNPFQHFDEFLTVAVDISPAVESVLKCDFLNVVVLDRLRSSDEITDFYKSMTASTSGCCSNDGVIEMLSESFHVVVFSLLLEYLPTNDQRIKCCQNAWQLLAVDGLLLIITPDSRRQHRNRRVAVDWRRDIESIGFARWRYEKLEHIHCMAYRKVRTSDGSTLSAVGRPKCVDVALQIPQDSRKLDDNYDTNDHSEETDKQCDEPDCTTAETDEYDNVLDELSFDNCDIFS